MSSGATSCFGARTEPVSNTIPMTLSRLPPPRWLSFDCFGTLIDWQTGVTRAFRELLPQGQEDCADLFAVWERIQWEKLRSPYLSYAEILRSSFCEASKRFGYPCRSYAADAFVDSLAHWEPFPDVNPALVPLARRYQLAIISNMDRHLLGGALRRLAVRFDALITAEDAQAYKPDPAIFQLALRRLGCSPQEVVHVAFGADYDLEPASALGFQVIYLNRQGLPRPATPLTAEIRSLEELPGLWETVPASPRAVSAASSGRRGVEP